MESKEESNPKTMARNKISTSYGLIIYTIHKARPMFLLTRRRDTFSYECILRGLYSEDLLSEYISNTTQEERQRLLHHEFDLLWKDLWVSTRRRLYRAELKRAKEHWEHSIEKIRNLILACPAVGRDIWEFPKGRMFVEETPHVCALREFEEETNISSSLVSIVNEAGTFEDNYQGTDHKMYRSIYYLGYIPNGMGVKFEYKDCPYQVRGPYISDEVMDIQWMDIESATEMITESRKKVLNKVVDFLNHSYQE